MFLCVLLFADNTSQSTWVSNTASVYTQQISFPGSWLVLRAEPTVTSASADTPAVAMAPHKDIPGPWEGGGP